MRISSTILGHVISVAADTPASPTDTGQAAFYAMVAAIVVAAGGVFVALLQSRSKSPVGTRSSRRAAAHYEACKLWISLNTDADVRKIKDGYETVDEVRRAGS